MKRGIVCLLALAAAAALSGCGRQSWLPYAQEMEDMALLRTMGLDGDRDRVELTVSTGSRFTGMDSQREDALVLTADGESVSGACLAVQSLGDSYVFYGYVDQLLLGEELAREGIRPALDYLAGDVQLSLGVRLWIVRGGTARQAMEAAGGRGVPPRLEQLQTDSELGAANIGRTAGETLTALEGGGSAYLPVLELRPAREGDGGEGAEMTLAPGGYAVIREGRLVCWLDADGARGLELLEGQAPDHIADLRLSDGTRASLRVTGGRVSCAPVFRGGELTGLEVKCHVDARVAQAERALQEEDLMWLRKLLEVQEGERIVEALELAQYWDADFLELERRAGMAAPGRWGQLREQWREAFRSLDIRVEVLGAVERSLGAAG